MEQGNCKKEIPIHFSYKILFLSDFFLNREN